jgi:hypothetical protein
LKEQKKLFSHPLKLPCIFSKYCYKKTDSTGFPWCTGFLFTTLYFITWLKWLKKTWLSLVSPQHFDHVMT